MPQAKPAKAKKAAPKKAAAKKPVERNLDDAAKVGFFCEAVGGPHDGLYGMLWNIGDVDEHGWPITAVVRARDNNADPVLVEYRYLRPSVAGKR